MIRSAADVGEPLMPRSVRKIALDALTLLLALAMAVAAGDNANARFNLASDEVVRSDSQTR